MHTRSPKLPKAPKTILKGSSLKDLLDNKAITSLSHNISLVYPNFKVDKFNKDAKSGLKELELLARGNHIAKILFEYLPKPYSKAINFLLDSLTPPLQKTEQNGLAVFFYLPHVCFVSQYGVEATFNNGKDPFEISMNAQYELTRRFSAEFSIRKFLIKDQDRTLSYLYKWCKDSCPHVRRLCSEGTRPRLPWAVRIPSFIKDPSPCLKILEALRDDPELYVRRSVANHIGDIAKDHTKLALSICKDWMPGASEERKWLIRHAVRYLAKKNHVEALKLREMVRGGRKRED